MPWCSAYQSWGQQHPGTPSHMQPPWMELDLPEDRQQGSGQPRTCSQMTASHSPWGLTGCRGMALPVNTLVLQGVTLCRHCSFSILPLSSAGT